MLARPEVRPSQLQMAEAIADVLEGDRYLAVEAGTGTGKSLAALVPAALSALQAGKRVVLAPHTIALQEQLTRKDVPLLLQLLAGGAELRTTVLKGRRNYICRRKLRDADKPWFPATFSSHAARNTFVKLVEFLQRQDATERDQVPFPISAEVWEPIQSEAESCLGPSCAYHRQCAYFRAAREAARADLVIANQALVMADLRQKALGEEGVLGKYDVLILDEAQHLEASVTNAWRTTISTARFEHVARALNQAARELGSRRRGANTFSDWAQALMRDGQEFLSGLGAPRLLKEAVGQPQPIRSLWGLVQAGLSLYEGADLAPGVQAALSAVAQRFSELVRDLDAWTGQQDSSYAYWVEGDRKGQPVAEMAPVEVAGCLTPSLFREDGPAVICMSATLSDELLVRCGFPKPTVLRLGSPFPLEKQALFYVPRQALDPTRDAAAYERYAAEEILRLTEVTEGRALVLFTARAMMLRVYDTVAPLLQARGQTPLLQDGTTSRGSLVQQFRLDEHSCLFGLYSMWEGVDVPGTACSAVILARLPFSVPTDPLSVARFERLKDKGQDPFKVLSLPEAVVRFRQGFGRLIRTADDVGVVACLDVRLLENGYGHTFRNAIAEVPGTRSLEKVRTLLDPLLHPRLPA